MSNNRIAHCPVCGKECETIYIMSSEVIGCERCYCDDGAEPVTGVNVPEWEDMLEYLDWHEKYGEG